MRKLSIKSFDVDHDLMKKGITISRTDYFGGKPIITFDIRMCTPNKESLSPKVSHTIEHLGAVYYRNLSPIRDDIVYFGPMGCLTGFYLIVSGNYSTMYIADTFMSMILWANTQNEVPGGTRKECGNYKLHSLRRAKKVLNNYKSILHEVLQ